MRKSVIAAEINAKPLLYYQLIKQIICYTIVKDSIKILMNSTISPIPITLI